jgi:hypothetical protein
MKANCKNCEKEFNYSPSQKSGIFCSWKCSGEFRLKQKFNKGTLWSKRMGTYLKEVRGNKCEVCGITQHNGKPITFQIDHINGDRNDNRFENLKIICPNCHSQTETYGIKNISEEAYNRMIEGAKLGPKIRNKKI